MIKLNKNRSENFLAFVSTMARSGSRPIIMIIAHSALTSNRKTKKIRLIAREFQIETEGIFTEIYKMLLAKSTV